MEDLLFQSAFPSPDQFFGIDGRSKLQNHPYVVRPGNPQVFRNRGEGFPKLLVNPNGQNLGLVHRHSVIYETTFGNDKNLKVWREN